MASKRHLHHIWRKIRPINQWYFLYIAIFLALVSVYALRQNNLTAIRLRDEVVAADKADKDVEKKLNNLREYVYSHMNADLSAGSGIQHPIQLKYRYDRLVAAEKKRVEGGGQSIYTEAQAVCEKKVPQGVSVSGRGRIECIEEYVTKNGGQSEVSINEDLYKFSFVSPRWSPDLAGLSMLFSGLFFMLFIVRYITEKWLQFKLRKVE